MKYCLLLLIFWLVTPAEAQPETNTGPLDLKLYVGFYDVGTKPGKSRFTARIYVDQNRLMFSAPGGDDSMIAGYVGNHRFEGKNNYNVQFEDDNEGKIIGFILYRPREEWDTDLYGLRNKNLEKYNNFEGLRLSERIESTHFNLSYSVSDSLNVKSIAHNLETSYSRITKKFGVADFPKVEVKVYPDFESYHLSVLTPGAPKWQKGMAWSAKDIRMVSPDALEGEERELARTGAAVHEFVHCIHMQIAGNMVAPSWLWEGVAMYVGCCKYQSEEIQELVTVKQPSLNNRRNPELAYHLGYFAVQYIASEFGWEAIIDLIKTGGDTKTVLNQSQSKFEKRFYEYMEKQY